MLVYFREKSWGAVNGFKIGSKNGMQIESQIDTLQSTCIRDI